MSTKKFRDTFHNDMSVIAREITNELEKYYENNGLSKALPTCATCAFMVKRGPARCKKYDLVPPVAVIVGDVKCDAYSDEEDIPF